MLLVLCWLTSGTSVVYDLSSSSPGELRPGCRIEFEIIVIVFKFVILSALHTKQEEVKASLVSL